MCHNAVPVVYERIKTYSLGGLSLISLLLTAFLSLIISATFFLNLVGTLIHTSLFQIL